MMVGLAIVNIAIYLALIVTGLVKYNNSDLTMGDLLLTSTLLALPVVLGTATLLVK